jgi:hypothetical protein
MNWRWRLKLLNYKWLSINKDVAYVMMHEQGSVKKFRQIFGQVNNLTKQRILNISTK